MIKRGLLTAAAVLMICFISGCATSKTLDLVKKPEPYSPSEETGKGIIYIFREEQFVGSARGIYINANGKRIGGLNSGTYFVYEAKPGKVTISIDHPTGKDPARNFNLQPGQSYFLRAGLKLGLLEADPFLGVVSEEEGKKVVSGLTYAVLWDPSMLEEATEPPEDSELKDKELIEEVEVEEEISENKED